MLEELRVILQAKTTSEESGICFTGLQNFPKLWFIKINTFTRGIHFSSNSEHPTREQKILSC